MGMGYSSNSERWEGLGRRALEVAHEEILLHDVLRVAGGLHEAGVQGHLRVNAA